jgi:histidine triad (HIT) family protein
MNPDPSCVFCRIVAGEEPASIVHSDADVTAFMDISPVVPGHTLVIPNHHTPGLDGLDDQAGARVMAVATRVAVALPEAGVRCEGVNLFLANGAVAGQTVFHVHMHVIPRFMGDPFKIRVSPWRRGTPTRPQLDDQASKLHEALERVRS